MLEVKIKKKLGAFTLDVAFEAENREKLALLGASGCGKSMTLKCIAGIERPDEGRIALDGKVLFDSAQHIDLKPQKRRVGYLFQQYALFPNMTVEQNIAAGVRVKDRALVRQAVAEKIAAMHLEGLEKKRPSQLSGGQQQRTALARILVNEPELLLLDEPFSALDSYLRWQMEMELSDTLRDFGGTVVFVSHSRDEVYRLCDSVCVLNHGHSEDKQPVRAMFENPQTYSACLLSGCKNFSRVEYEDATHVRALDWGVTLEIPSGARQDAKWMGVRAHFIRMTLSSQGVNSIPCGIERVVENTFSTVVMCTTPGGNSGRSLLRVELPKENWQELGQPTELYLTIDSDTILLLDE